ncbi:MAG: hypothetical protein JO096_10665 [Alphaproteobacteria bacterium]|nr:hypothetical protein [Alphaproteobacteria bacterium]
MAGGLLVLVVAIVLDRRPYRPGKQNYVPIMIIALAASLVLRNKARDQICWSVNVHSSVPFAIEGRAQGWNSSIEVTRRLLRA